MPSPLRKLQDAFEDGTWYQCLIPAAEALSGLAVAGIERRPGGRHPHGHRDPRQSADSPVHGPRGEFDGRASCPLELDDEPGEWQPKKGISSPE